MAQADSTNVAIESLIADFTSRLSIALRYSALEQVISALGADAPNRGAKRRGRPLGSKNAMPGAKAVKVTRGPRGGRRSTEEKAKMANAILAHVKSNPGQLGTGIANAVGTDVNTMRPVMKTLIASKKIKTHGQRRGMTYSAAGAAPTSRKTLAKKTK